MLNKMMELVELIEECLYVFLARSVKSHEDELVFCYLKCLQNYLTPSQLQGIV